MLIQLCLWRLWINYIFLIYDEYFFYICGCVTTLAVPFWSDFMYFKSINSLFFSLNTYVDAMPKISLWRPFKKHSSHSNTCKIYTFYNRPVWSVHLKPTHVQHVWGRCQQLVGLTSKLEVKEKQHGRLCSVVNHQIHYKLTKTHNSECYSSLYPGYLLTLVS